MLVALSLLLLIAVVYLKLEITILYFEVQSRMFSVLENHVNKLMIHPPLCFKWCK